MLPIQEDGITYGLSQQLIYDNVDTITGQELLIEAVDSNNVLVWKSVYLKKDFIPMLETDAQEVFPIDFYFDENKRDIIIKFEQSSNNQEVFRVAKNDGRLIVD